MDQPKIERLLRLMQMLSSNVNYSVDDLIASFYEDFYETAPGDGLRKKQGRCVCLGAERNVATEVQILGEKLQKGIEIPGEKLYIFIEKTIVIC